MTNGRASLLTACLACIVAGEARATTFSSALGISNLTKGQEKRFEERACRPHGVGMYAAEGVGYPKGNDFKLTMVNVRCDPHRHVEGQPVAYEVYCRRDPQDAWDCGHAEERLFARIDGTMFSIGANHGAVPIDEAYRVFRYLAARGALHNVLLDKPFDYREEREVAFAVWKDEGNRVFAHCDRYMVLTRLGPGEYRLEPPELELDHDVPDGRVVLERIHR